MDKRLRVGGRGESGEVKAKSGTQCPQGSRSTAHGRSGFSQREAGQRDQVEVGVGGGFSPTQGEGLGVTCLVLKVSGSQALIDIHRSSLNVRRGIGAYRNVLETWTIVVRAHTHRPIFRGFLAESAVESADSIPDSAD